MRRRYIQVISVVVQPMFHPGDLLEISLDRYKVRRPAELVSCSSSNLPSKYTDSDLNRKATIKHWHILVNSWHLKKSVASKLVCDVDMIPVSDRTRMLAREPECENRCISTGSSSTLSLRRNVTQHPDVQTSNVQVTEE